MSLAASSGVCRGQGSAVTQGVVGGIPSGVCRGQGWQIQDRSSHKVSSEMYIIFDVRRGQGFADLREGCHGGCRWRCHGGDSQYLFQISSSVCLYLISAFGLFLAQKYIYGRRSIL